MHETPSRRLFTPLRVCYHQRSCNLSRHIVFFSVGWVWRGVLLHPSPFSLSLSTPSLFQVSVSSHTAPLEEKGVSHLLQPHSGSIFKRFCVKYIKGPWKDSEDVLIIFHSLFPLFWLLLPRKKLFQTSSSQTIILFCLWICGSGIQEELGQAVPSWSLSWGCICMLAKAVAIWQLPWAGCPRWHTWLTVGVGSQLGTCSAMDRNTYL